MGGENGMNWTQQQAIDLCVKIEAVCPAFGCHVALTGGLLYKQGERKDCDILFYRIRQRSEIDMDGLKFALVEIGVDLFKGFGWCYKAVYVSGGIHKQIDCFFPEEQGGEYNAKEAREAGIEGRSDMATMREPFNEHLF